MPSWRFIFSSTYPKVIIYPEINYVLYLDGEFNFKFESGPACSQARLMNYFHSLMKRVERMKYSISGEESKL